MEGATLVMKSTVPVGTGERSAPMLGSTGRLRLEPRVSLRRHGLEDFMSPDRVVVGPSTTSTATVAALYEGFDAPIVRTDVASAEMIKLASNAFLATRISFINEIANVSEPVGRRRRRGRPGHGPRPAASARASCAPDRLRRLLLPEGRLRS